MSAKLEQGVKDGNLDQIMDALKEGADPDDVIHLACELGELKIVRKLLNAGANPSIRSWKWRDTPLHRACVFGHAPVVKELLQFKAHINVRNINQWMTPLEVAITFEHIECVRLLIDAGAFVNVINWDYKSTPLIEACSKGNYEIVKLLLDSHADPNLGVDVYPLYKAICCPKIVRLLLERGAKVDCLNDTPSEKGDRPLHQACMYGCVESVKLLLNAGADTKMVNTRGDIPLNRAEWQLSNNMTSPESTAEIIERLKEVIQELKRKEVVESGIQT